MHVLTFQMSQYNIYSFGWVGQNLCLKEPPSCKEITFCCDFPIPPIFGTSPHLMFLGSEACDQIAAVCSLFYCPLIDIIGSIVPGSRQKHPVID